MTPDLQQRLDKLNAWIEQLARDVENGAEADLAGLDKKIAAVCEEAARQANPDDPDLRARMDHLLRNIETLQGTVTQQFEMVQTRLQGHGKRSEAKRAYNQWMAVKPSKST